MSDRKLGGGSLRRSAYVASARFSGLNLSRSSISTQVSRSSLFCRYIIPVNQEKINVYFIVLNRHIVLKLVSEVCS